MILGAGAITSDCSCFELIVRDFGVFSSTLINVYNPSVHFLLSRQLQYLLSAPVVERGRCLVYRQDEELGDIDVWWTRRSPDNLLCDVLSNN